MIRRFNLMVMVLFLTLFFQNSPAWSTDRFVDLHDGTVFDTANNLRWLKNANCTDTAGGIVKSGGIPGALDGYDAVTWSDNLTSGLCGLVDGSSSGTWHLPTKDELNTLVALPDNYRASQLNGLGFYGVQDSDYWSSSSDTYFSSWIVNFYVGNMYQSQRDYSNYVWPVRAGQTGTLSVSPPAKDFGNITTTATSTSQTFTISNSGAINAVTGIIITGGDNTLFVLDKGDGNNGTCGDKPILQAGDSCTLTVAFTPSSAGAKSTALRITSIGAAPTQDIPLTGTGVSQVIQSYDPNVSWWRAENNSNDSVGSNHGTLHGAVAFTSGKVGQAFSFDASQAQYVAVASSPSLNIFGNHSIAFWVKLAELPATDKTYHLVSKWTNGLEHKQVTVGPDGKVGYFLFGTTATSGVTSAAALQTGVWNHVAATYDGVYMKLYINGVQDASTPANNDVGDSTGTLYLGHNPEISWSQYFKGQLDEIGWYNRTLSQIEITALNDSTPDDFSFPPRLNSPLSALVESATITVSGIGLGTEISVSGGEYAISTDNGSTWGSWTTAPGMVSLNNQVKLRLTSASTRDTQTTATLTIGGVSGAFTVTTLRFVDLGDGTVLDTIHSLRWLKNAACTDTAGGIAKIAGSLVWADAQIWSNNLASPACALKDGSATGDWHLSTIDELLSLIPVADVGYRYDLLNEAGFSDVQADDYWSSSTNIYNPSSAWIVYMVSGGKSGSDKDNYHYVWPVRGGQYWAVGPLVTLGNGTFGNLPVGSASSGRQFIVKNAAATAQPVSGITLSGAESNQFSVTTGGSLPCTSLTPTLAAGASCTVMVTATATSIGAKTANLTVATAAGSAAIPLTVTAIYPVPVVTSISPSSGFAAGGTSVIISGANLSGATVVKFASTNAPDFTASSANQVTATSPAGVVGQIADITVTTAGGTSSTSSADQFSYTLQYQAQNHSTNPYAPYITLTEAITAALVGAEVRAYGGQFDGVFSLTRDIILNGGYNYTFDAKDSLPTTLNGNLTVQGGNSSLQSTNVKGLLTIKGGSLRTKDVKVRQ